MNIKRFQRTLNEINKFGALDKGITRLAYSKEEKRATEYFVKLCKEEGLKVRRDSCGNVIARREGRNPRLPVVAIGSHLDTVIQGGKYDGAIGVIAGLEVIRSMNEKQITTEHPIEIISFACEESSRFGVSTIGSKAMTGSLEKKFIERLVDKNKVSVPEAFSDYSLDFSKIEDCKRKNSEFKVFIELHIEQGPILELERKQIGVVYGIAAPTRIQMNVTGKASHSGTTPMNRRKDALLGAAEVALELEKSAKGESRKGTVATVGVFEVGPGAMNVIPGEVEMKIDIRGTSSESKAIVLKNLFESVEMVKSKRELDIDWKLLSDEKPVLLNSEVVESLKRTCERLGLSYVTMSSGAGHDAMNLAKICPTGLIFIPSKDGLSHHPDEFTAIEDIEKGIMLLEEEVIQWAIPIDTSMTNQRWERIL